MKYSKFCFCVPPRRTGRRTRFERRKVAVQEAICLAFFAVGAMIRVIQATCLSPVFTLVNNAWRIKRPSKLHSCMFHRRWRSNLLTAENCNRLYYIVQGHHLGREGCNNFPEVDWKWPRDRCSAAVSSWNPRDFCVFPPSKILVSRGSKSAR